jgi:hypothetical protein
MQGPGDVIRIPAQRFIVIPSLKKYFRREPNHDRQQADVRNTFKQRKALVAANNICPAAFLAFFS